MLKNSEILHKIMYSFRPSFVYMNLFSWWFHSNNDDSYFPYYLLQIQDIANGASSDSEYVDWRRFLMALAQPIPTPTQTDLLETLYRFKEMDQKDTGFVTKEQYDRVGHRYRIVCATKQSRTKNRLSCQSRSVK